MATDFFILILGQAVANPHELAKLRAFQPELLCFAAEEVSLPHECFLEAIKDLAFTTADWEVCQQATQQVINTPQLTVILQKATSGQTNVLSFQQALGRRQNSRNSLLEKLSEIEQMLSSCLQINQESWLLCQAIVQKQLSEQDRVWIRGLEQTMVSHLREMPLSVEELASMACLSTRQLNRRLRAVLGVSPAQLIREVQLQLAWQAFENDQPESVIQVALSSGFEHASTFSTLFKQRFGRSPRYYLNAKNTGK